ncbi:hypothetical protein FRC01_005518, partial [Tulasnella sp. 417]
VQVNEDIKKTLDDIAAHDLEVVRIWGFREVVGQTYDDPATYTQQWVNGEQKCNQAGIDRIKFILDEAEKRNMYVQVVLTNNWAPDFPAHAAISHPPGSLSNSFGGMDTFVQQIHPGGDHDLFYTDDAVKDSYKKWLNCIVPQLASHKALFAWEMANDPRCQGADGRTTSGSCNTHSITRWTAETSQHVKSLDPNHMAASGDGGFFCTDCKKLYPLPPPPPAVSGGSPDRARKRGERTGYLTSAMVREQIKAREKAAYRAARNAPGAKRSIRGGWAAPATSFKRQSESGLGPNFDGSQGVDSEDIINIPSVNFGTFQLFPDQHNYAASDPNLPQFNNTVNQGISWIQSHAAMGALFNKPVTLNGFGLVTQNNAADFVPFKSNAEKPVPDASQGSSPGVVSESQQNDAYQNWLTAGINHGLSGITNHQWGQSGLEARPSSKRSVEARQYSNGGSDWQGTSPDDGYRVLKEGTKTIFKNSGKKQKRKSGRDSD